MDKYKFTYLSLLILHDLGALLARYARSGALQDGITNRPWKERELGLDID